MNKKLILIFFFIFSSNQIYAQTKNITISSKVNLIMPVFLTSVMIGHGAGFFSMHKTQPARFFLITDIIFDKILIHLSILSYLINIGKYLFKPGILTLNYKPLIFGLYFLIIGFRLAFINRIISFIFQIIYSSIVSGKKYKAIKKLKKGLNMKIDLLYKKREKLIFLKKETKF